MITKIFHPVFSGGSRYSRDIQLRARVTTDHATHTVTQTFSNQGIAGRLFPEQMRFYTPAQEQAVIGLFAYHYPLVKMSIENFMAAHNFPANSEGTVHVDKDHKVSKYYYLCEENV